MAARKSVDKELTREMIMDAARDLFVEKGYQYVSMQANCQGTERQSWCNLLSF